MYENITYDQILQRMLDRIPDTVDKREGSIIYDAIAPAAVEFQNMLIQLDAFLNETFADTASRPYLIQRAKERGIVPYPATYAVLKAESAPNTADIPIGSRFSLNDLNYIITEKITDGEYNLQCETAGTVGNSYFGDLIPIDYISGLESISLTELIAPGEDEEDTEALRERYFDTIGSQAFGGNIEDYKVKTKELNGVGGVKVYPVWNGGGTVKLVILNSDFEVASTELVSQVQAAIDPIQNQGQGVGIAPIGHVVTVVSCGETAVNISTDLTFQEGWTWDDVQINVEAAIDNYFKELSKDWENHDNIIVRISQIELRFLNITGILDVADTTLNGEAQNLTIAADNIPTRGGISNV